MYEMNTLKSLSLFVGTGNCNANCAHCAGKVHRKYAPKKDGIIDEYLIYETLKICYQQGARSLSISSSGEPTLSPIAITKTIKLIYDSKGIEYSLINLYSNGIKIGEDQNFCDTYLHLWKSYGLTTIYVTVHDVDKKKNARIYGIDKYPSLDRVISRIHKANLLMRANVVLSKKSIGTYERFVSIVKSLKKKGVDCISAWPIRDVNDGVNYELSPLEKELDKMEDWVEKNQDVKFKIRLLREKSRILYETNQKLTLFHDGSLSSTWCNY